MQILYICAELVLRLTPVTQAHRKLKPPMRPNTSSTSPHTCSPGSSCSARCSGSVAGRHEASKSKDNQSLPLHTHAAQAAASMHKLTAGRQR
jgi:capsular polysaccharide biosynthesis protein